MKLSPSTGKSEIRSTKSETNPKRKSTKSKTQKAQKNPKFETAMFKTKD